MRLLSVSFTAGWNNTLRTQKVKTTLRITGDGYGINSLSRIIDITSYGVQKADYSSSKVYISAQATLRFQVVFSDVRGVTSEFQFVPMDLGGDMRVEITYAIPYYAGSPTSSPSSVAPSSFAPSSSKPTSSVPTSLTPSSSVPSSSKPSTSRPTSSKPTQAPVPTLAPVADPTQSPVANPTLSPTSFTGIPTYIPSSSRPSSSRPSSKPSSSEPSSKPSSSRPSSSSPSSSVPTSELVVIAQNGVVRSKLSTTSSAIGKICIYYTTLSLNYFFRDEFSHSKKVGLLG